MGRVVGVGVGVGVVEWWGMEQEEEGVREWRRRLDGVVGCMGLVSVEWEWEWEWEWAWEQLEQRRLEGQCRCR